MTGGELYEPPTKRVEIRVSAADRKRWRVSASAAGLSLSEWIRRQCNVAAFEQASIDRLKRPDGAGRDVDIHIGSLGIWTEGESEHRKRAMLQRAHGRGGTVVVTHVDRNAGTITVENVE